MGVHGLWQLLHPSGRPVTLESLEGKVLAVDVSIWLHQALKGMRDKDGNVLPNAHLQGLFTRVCKLMFYRIKPVFVFDGGVPDLKRQTLAARREKKTEAQRERDEIGKKLLENLIKSQAVKQALGTGSGSSGGPPVRVPGVKGKRGENDLFELAPLPESQEVGLTMSSEAWDNDFEQQENWIKEGLATLSKVDPDSAEFKSLPMEIQHEALVDLKEERKYHSLSRISKMPEDADSFSSYQLKKLMKVCDLTTRIDNVRKDMSNRTTKEMSNELGGEYYGDEVEARRIVSEDASHYILIKGLTKQKQLEEAEKYELDRKIKIEKEEQDEEGKPQQTQEKSSSLFKRPLQEKDDHVTQKKMKSDKGKDGKEIEQSMRKGAALLSSVISDGNDDVDEMSDDKGEESDDFETSSSEDEGFIEVTFDPNQTVEEDDLFPASIFETTTVDTNNTTTDNASSEPVIDVDITVKQEPLDDIEFVSASHRKKNNSRDSVVTRKKGNGDRVEKGFLNKEGKKMKKEKESESENEADSGLFPSRETRQTSASSLNKSGDAVAEEMGSMAEKRKNVLSDILAELQKKKETLNSLSVEEDGDFDDNSKADGGNDIGDFNVDSKEKETSNDEDNEMEGVGDEDFLPGGFIREGSISSDDEGDLRKDTNTYVGNEIKINRVSEYSNSSNDKKSMGVESDGDESDAATSALQNTIMNDSEDEDLKLAIELSLQTARQERGENSREGGSKSRRSSGFENKYPEVLSPLNESENFVRDKFSDDDDASNNENDDDDGDFEMVESMEDEEAIKSHENANKSPVVDRFSGEIDEIETSSVAKDVDHANDDDEGNSDDAISTSSANGLESSSRFKTPIHEASIDNTGGANVSPTKMLTQERLQPEDLDDPFATFQQSNLQNIREELESERTNLLSEQGRQERFATSLTDQIVLEAQELLNMFGIPYVVSPMEAEAQCAFLDVTKQTQGTITDDSDIWLFGGTRVYKNFFNQSKFVEFFSVESIKSHFGLTREQLIKIALLCGSDYTVGLQGVGPVRALEIMAEFQGDGLAGLMAFRKWWDVSHKKPVMPGENKLRSRLKQLSLEGGFPSARVMEAYLCPAVDESREKFSWGQPDLDLLRQFARMKFGWAREKSDSVLEPMMKQHLKSKTQDRIYSYFQPSSYIPSSTATAHSDRIKKALSVMQAQKSSTADARPDNNKTTRVRKRRSDNDDKTGGDNDEDTNKNSETKRVKNTKKSLMKSGNKKDDSNSNPDTVGDNESVLGKKTKTVTKPKGSVVGRKGKKAVLNNKRTEDIVEEDSNSKPGDVQSAPMEVWIKTEKNSDDDDDNIDKFMTVMQEKVDKASSLLSKNNAAAKRGRGGGRGRKDCRGGGGGGKSKSNSGRGRVPSVVPSLERSGVKGWGGRGQRGKSSSRNEALNRGVICLSESSSDDDDNGNDNDDDDDDKGRNEEDYFYLRGKVDKSNIAASNERASKAVVGQRSSVSENNKSKGDDKSSSQSRLSKDGELGQEKRRNIEFSSIKVNVPLPVKTNFVTDAKSKINEDIKLEKETRKESLISREVKEKTQKKDAMVVKRNAAVEKREKSEGKRVEENRGQSTDEDDDDRGKEDEEEEVGQAPGKNPDVSIINAITLKATLSYLNQRSMGEKQLLNALGGRKGELKNAVERRMEEEERIEKWGGGVDRLSGGGGSNQKEVKKSSSSGGTTKKQKKRSGPKPSFEDMLGSTEVLLTTKSSKSTGNVKKSDKTQADSKPTTGKGESVTARNVDTNSNRQGRESSSKPKTQRQDKFGSQVSHLSDIQSVKDHGKLPLQNRSTKSQAFDIPIGRSAGGEGKTINSKRSQAFDTPIGGGRSDSDNVGGGGFVGDKNKIPKQVNKSKKSQAFDAPISGGSDHGGGAVVSRGRAVAGKGKGIGKNRHGRQQQQQQHQRRDDGGDSNTARSRTGGSIPVRTSTLTSIESASSKARVAHVRQKNQVSSVLASSGVSQADIMQYGCMTMDDLGSDFDDDDF